MNRYALCLALVSLGCGAFAMTASATAAGAKAEAKKVCSEQWDAEKKSNTVPRGMTQQKYMKQCTTNYRSETTPPPAPPAEQTPPASPAAWPPAPGQ
jgi:hypothetical protein